MKRAVVIASLAAGALAVGGAMSSVPPDWAVAVFPSGAEFGLEIAADPESRARGYMFRERVGPREGMLFIFDEADRHGIWMKNCRVALDLIWLDEQFRVVFVATDQQPCVPERRCPTVAPLAAARYVLEVAAGVVEREGLEVGHRLEILSEPPLP